MGAPHYGPTPIRIGFVVAVTAQFLHTREDVMPVHTPEERARNAPIRARQGRRNARKAGTRRKNGNPPRSTLRKKKKK